MICRSRLVGRFERDYRAGRLPAMTPGSVPSVHQSGLSAAASTATGSGPTISDRSSTGAANPKKRFTERSLSGKLPANTCVLIILAPSLRLRYRRCSNSTSRRIYSALVCGHESTPGSVAADPILSEVTQRRLHDRENGSFRARIQSGTPFDNMMRIRYLL